MRKAVLISIQPKWCELIASGRKTIEMRKTKPKIPTPFKCYIYQTKRTWIYNIYSKIADWQQKVIGEFVCDGITEYPYETFNDGEHFMPYGELEKICLDGWELYEYLGIKDGYGWHISNLVIYDKPKELGEFYKPAICDYNEFEQITRPLQSWCYVERLVGEQ